MEADGSQSANKGKRNMYFSKSVEDAQRHLDRYKGEYGYNVLGEGVYLKDDIGLFQSLFFINLEHLHPDLEYNLILVRHGRAEHNVKSSGQMFLKDIMSLGESRKKRGPGPLPPHPVIYHYKKNTSLMKGSDDEVIQSAKEFENNSADIKIIHGIGVSDLKRTQETSGYFLSGLTFQKIKDLQRVIVVPCLHELAPQGQSGETDEQEENAKFSRLTGRWMHKENESTCRDNYDFNQLRKRTFKSDVTLCDKITVNYEKSGGEMGSFNLGLIWKYYLKFYNSNFDDDPTANRKYREESNRFKKPDNQKCSKNNFLGKFFEIMYHDTSKVSQVEISQKEEPQVVPNATWQRPYYMTYDGRDKEEVNEDIARWERDERDSDDENYEGGNKRGRRRHLHLRRHKRTFRKTNRIGKRKTRRNNKIKTKRKTKR